MELDTKAVQLAKDFKRTEAELLRVLIEMDEKRAFPPGYTGIFYYCSKRLKLGEAQSSYFAKVARKSQEVPALKTAIDEGTLTLSQARRIVPVVTRENSQEWIQKAANLKQVELERAVTVANPKSVIRERLKPVAPTRTELRVGISVALEKKLRRLQDLLSKQNAASLEDVLEKIATEYLERHDPIKKGERAVLRKPTNHATRNVVHLRDQGTCSHPGCDSQRWLHVHHIKPRALGGPDTMENLTLLCAAHHRETHRADTLKAPS